MENENNNENSNSNVAGTSTGKNNKIFLAMAVGSIVLMAVTALIFFFTALKGAEQTMVPEVRGKELTVALLELQVKELYPRIQLRYSQSSLDRGKILEQNPEAGTIVKAGRRINLVVSQGVVVNRIENFIGRNIDDVRLEMQTIVTPSGSPLLLIKDPLMYDYSPSAAGIILQQKPEPGTDISGQTTMEFVVSQGQGNTLTTMPAFAGLSIASALELLGKTDLVYQFFIRDIRDGEKGETVVHQNPAGGVSIPTGTIAEIVVNTKKITNTNRGVVPKNHFASTQLSNKNRAPTAVKKMQLRLIKIFL